MKYIVLQCYNGYAVLIDEHSRYVFAANKGYKVGQTVTDPVIMSDGNKKEKNFGAVIRCISAAVACVGILTLCGFSYYSANLKTYSTITIDTASAISMEVNRTGKVIRLVSDTDKGKEIIKNSDVKGMDTVSAANKIIKAEIENGYISDGETVDVVISGDASADADTFKTELETEMPELDVDVNVHEHTPKKPVKDTAPKAEKEKPVKDTTPKAEKEKPVPDKNKDKENTPLPVTTEPAPAVTTAAAVKTPVAKPPAATLPAETPKPPAKENGKKNIKENDKVKPHAEKPTAPAAPVTPEVPETPETPETPQPATKPAVHEKENTPQKPDKHNQQTPPHENRNENGNKAELPVAPETPKVHETAKNDKPIKSSILPH